MLDKLIVMLTNNDKTVENAFGTFMSCEDLPVVNWGYKDVGMPEGEMKQLCNYMKHAGKKTFLEVVSYSKEECMRGAKLAVACGFDYLLGTIFYEEVFEYIQENDIEYFPFVGHVEGSPSILRGSLEDMICQSDYFSSKGVAGIDILGYRYVDGNPVDLSREFIEHCKLPVVLAGSISSKERIDTALSLNPWCFTMGSALFASKFVEEGSFRENLEAVVSYIQSKE